jgi:hypothetical protein
MDRSEKLQANRTRRDTHFLILPPPTGDAASAL